MEIFKLRNIICKADINARYALMLDSSFPTTTNKYSDKDRFVAMLQENAFFHAVNLLHTLLATRYERTELKIKPILKKKILDQKGLLFVNSEEDLQKVMFSLLKWLNSSYPEFNGHDNIMMSLQNSSDVLTEARRFRRKKFGIAKLLEIEKEYKQGKFDTIRNNISAHSNRSSIQLGSLIPIRKDLIIKLCKLTKALMIESCFWLDYAPENHYEFVLEKHKKIF